MKLKLKITLFVLAALFFVNNTVHAQEKKWSMTDAPLMTKWGDDVNPSNVLPEHPRPMLQRENWQNLNGLWDFKTTHKSGEDDGGEYSRKILVPFPVESALSGIADTVSPEQRVWYKRSFEVDKPNENDRVLLHFGASDWETHVLINDEYVGNHQGGYDPFSFDITDNIKRDDSQEIEITVWDPTDGGYQPVGKQSNDPRSIWYTAVTGIWQTVWLEYVPQSYIKDLKITPDVDNDRVKIDIEGKNIANDQQVKIEAIENGNVVGESKGSSNQTFLVDLENPQLWSPDDPFLYDLNIELVNKEGNPIDQISSYFGMRKIDIAKAEDGFMRLFLNNEPLFHIGPLDQGWWPDGLYTAPSDEALKYDIEVTKKLGFNMLRKHVKVEPQRFYYWADKLGVLVWQDMPNGDTRPDQIPERSKESATQFKKEYKRMIDANYNHPSIVMWVPFNEGWGQSQSETEKITKWTKKYDPSRLVNNASGWHDTKLGDVVDIHIYPGPNMAKLEENRASVLGEFGGEAYVDQDHLWLEDFSRAPSHYETSQSESELHKTYNELIDELLKLKVKGLSAAVYTQTTDVETEVNGLMTYDREKIKFDYDQLRNIHKTLIVE